MRWSREAYQRFCANLCYGPVHDVLLVLFVLFRICNLQILLNRVPSNPNSPPAAAWEVHFPGRCCVKTEIRDQRTENRERRTENSDQG
jgi:hypothetical protein